VCGIAGAVGLNAREDLVNKMSLMQKHRGPDSSHRWSDKQCCFAMERLSIVDLTSGTQPYFNEDKTLIVIFNGEIYNHKELRKNLLSKGHKFNSDHSDGEVIPHLFEEYGYEMPNFLEGMFSIALWNSKTEELLLVRDNFGIKPLYYLKSNNSLFFSSEINPLLKSGQESFELSHHEIDNYFNLGHSSSPNTVYQNIKQLEPATLLIYKDNIISHRLYWTPKQEIKNFDLVKNSSSLLSLIEQSVIQKMESDVEVGSLLSGGLDSSIVTSIASKVSKDRLKTFNLYYPDLLLEGKDSDAMWARKLAKTLNVEHFEIPMTHHDLTSNLPKIISAFAEPFAGVTSTFFISEYISKHVKVALTGDGSDEMFGSYFFHRLGAILDKSDTLESDILNILGISQNDFEIFKSQTSEIDRRMVSMRSFEGDVCSYYSANFKESIGFARNPKKQTIKALERAMKGVDFGKKNLDHALWMDFHELLPNEVLPFVDRLSMSWSLELRPVYLTKEIYELSTSVPSNQKISGSINKQILKNAAKQLLPAELIHRKKEGFILPVSEWLKFDIKDWALAVLSPDKTNQHGYWDSEKVYRLIKDYDSSNHRKAKLIWKFIVFQIWWENFYLEAR
jgi:asparagine synthase (glutamine-hydrolysing)